MRFTVVLLWCCVYSAFSKSIGSGTHHSQLARITSNGNIEYGAHDLGDAFAVDSKDSGQKFGAVRKEKLVRVSPSGNIAIAKNDNETEYGENNPRSTFADDSKYSVHKGKPLHEEKLAQVSSNGSITLANHEQEPEYGASHFGAAFAEASKNSEPISRVMREDKHIDDFRSNDDPTRDKEKIEKATRTSSAVHLLQWMIVIVFAFLYKQRVVDVYPRQGLHALQPQPEPEQKDFRKGMCDCCSDMHVCLHAACCWQARAAHTWEVMGIIDYWLGFFAALCCPLCMPCIGGCFWRAKLREKFGIERNALNDFCMWFWCVPCAVGQETMQVDEVAGVSVQCCCKLAPISDGAEALVPNDVDTEVANNDTGRPVVNQSEEGQQSAGDEQSF